MRTLLLCLLIICALCRQNTNAQTTFAPTGAEWHHEVNGGSFHCYRDGDSVIQGKTVHVIRQKAIISADSWAYDHPTIYTYTTTDTVYIFNPLFNRFTPLYIFNVSDGDTVCIRGFHAQYTGNSYDTLFCFRVDSVRIVLYDTAMLKTVYTQSLTDGPLSSLSHVYSTYGTAPNKFGAYAERIGCVESGISPSCIGCPVMPEYCECIGPIRCYKDPTLSIKLVSGVCQPPISVMETIPEKHITINPNPANDIINITSAGDATAELLTIDGELISTSLVDKNDANNISTANIASGTYLIRVTFVTGMRYYQLLQVVH